MSEQQPENSSDAGESQRQMGLMLQRRALYQMERAKDKARHSPKQIALVSIAVLITMCLFLAFIDKGVKVAHHIMDIWTPVVVDAYKKKPPSAVTASSAPTTISSSQSSQAEAAYMIRVEPVAPVQSSQSSSQNTKR